MRDTVLRAIRGLPEDQRTAITLFYIDGYSVRQVADFLDVLVTTVNNRLHASRMQLKERMMKMVADTVKEFSLPEDFARRILMFPFPRAEPSVTIVDRPGESMTRTAHTYRAHWRGVLGCFQP